MERVRPPTDAEVPHCPHNWYYSSHVRGSSRIRVESLFARGDNYAKSAAVLRLEDAMDDHGQLEYATARGNDYLGHEQMYRTFVTLTKTAVAVLAVILILMAIFLA
jgi:hypothetical protein